MRMTTRILLLLWVLFIAVAMPQQCQAKYSGKYKKVRYKVENGTLTIWGKGPVSSKMKYGKKKKIKKVVIKKGITYLPDNYFDGCKNLKTVKLPSSLKGIGCYCFTSTAVKKVTIPASTKQIGQGAFAGCKKLTKMTMPGDATLTLDPEADMQAYYLNSGGNLKEVRFSTPLKLELVTALETMNLRVKKTDPKYKSIKGVIYSKDGKDLVRVPMRRKKLEIEDGCENFCLQSVLYCSIDGEESDPIDYCDQLTTFIIPASVKTVEREKYRVWMREHGWAQGDCSYLENVTSVQLNNTQLKTKSLAELISACPRLDLSKFSETVPGRLQDRDGYYVLDGDTLVRIQGVENAIVIPEGIKTIQCFAYVEEINSIQSIQLASSVEVIGAFAFATCCSVDTVAIPCGLQSVDWYSFSWDVTFTYEGAPEQTRVFPYLYRDWMEEDVLNCKWQTMAGVCEVEVEVYEDSSCTTLLKKEVCTKSYIELPVSETYENLYVRIRPCTMVNGAKVWGLWQGTDEMHKE